MSEKRTYTDAIIVRVNEMKRLPKGWNGYGGIGTTTLVALTIASTLERLWIDGLPVPALVPEGDGTAQAEWHYGDVYVEIDFFLDGTIEALRYREDDGPDDEEHSTHLAEVHSWLVEMVNILSERVNKTRKS